MHTKHDHDLPSPYVLAVTFFSMWLLLSAIVTVLVLYPQGMSANGARKYRVRGRPVHQAAQQNASSAPGQQGGTPDAGVVKDGGSELGQDSAR